VGEVGFGVWVFGEKGRSLPSPQMVRQDLDIESVRRGLESLWVHFPRLAACAVIPADAGIQKPDWRPPAYHMPGQAYQGRHDAEYPADCGGVVYCLLPIPSPFFQKVH
jgi:hypothetical protein